MQSMNRVVPAEKWPFKGTNRSNLSGFKYNRGRTFCLRGRIDFRAIFCWYEAMPVNDEDK
jgi:hypothetical protein